LLDLITAEAKSSPQWMEIFQRYWQEYRKKSRSLKKGKTGHGVSLQCQFPSLHNGKHLKIPME